MGMVKRKIGDILTLQRGYDLPASKMEGGNVAVVGSNGIIGYHNIVKYDAPCIIVGRSGSVGKVRYYSIPTWPHNTALFVKDFKGNDPLSLYYFLKNLHLDEKFSKSSSVVPSLDRNIVHSLHVQFQEDINEQKNIAKILSAFDIKIALNRQINDNLEAMARQLYDYWFVQFDFPDKNGKPYKSSGGKMVWCNKLKREIPEGWMVLSINDLATTCRGVSYDASQVSDTKTPKHDILVLRGNNIKNSHIVLDSNTAYISSSLVSPEQRIHRHDIIMTMSSGSKEHLGKCGMFQFDSQHTFGAFLTKFTPKKDSHYYVFSFLMSAWYKAKIKSICNGTGINNLTNENFNQVLLPVPPNQYICLFNSTVSASFDRIGENEMQTEELSIQRDELLPLLMNGQVSVKQLNNHLSAD